MQIIYHSSSRLTTPQKFFIERSIELLYRSTIDSYRVRVKNPRTILAELRHAILAFERGQIKSFIAITANEKTKFSLKDEALELVETQPNYLKYQTFSAAYFVSVLKTVNEHNYKRAKDCLSVLLKENEAYLDEILDGLLNLLKTSPTEKTELWLLLYKIDTTLGILYTELLETGFSKGFLYRFIYSVFVNNTETFDFNNAMALFVDRIKLNAVPYTVVFRIDTTGKVRDSLRTIDSISQVYTDLNDLNDLAGNREFDNFVTNRANRCFIKSRVIAPDYLTALKKAKASLAENLDVLNLGYGDEHLRVHPRVLVLDESNPAGARFQEGKNFLDGKYRVAQEHYYSFIERLPTIIARSNINTECKEKIKSAIRYLRLGNESTEVEHKFINYWIGLEYLFSNYESTNTINRIKEYFVACHSLSYVKRNAYDFHKSLSMLARSELEGLTHYHTEPALCLLRPEFYEEVADAFNENHPLIAYRARNLGNALCPTNGTNKIKRYVERHQKNSIIHFTRIYRLRNEIIHDAATNTNNESIASNLRYYLTFILNGAIAYLSKADGENVSIEDYFTINEIHLGNIAHNKWKLEDLLNVDTPIDFIH